MTITKNIENDGKKALLILEGRIDTVTSADLEKAIAECSAASEIVLDFARLIIFRLPDLELFLQHTKHFQLRTVFH